VLDGPLEDATRLVEAVAGIEHPLDPQPVAAPLLDLVEVAPVGAAYIGRRSAIRSAPGRRSPSPLVHDVERLVAGRALFAVALLALFVALFTKGLLW
jgi:hypothetical protein